MPEPHATEADRVHLRHAIDLAKHCPPGATFSVGAVVTDAAGTVLAAGYSRESDERDHAEEAALAKLSDTDSRLPDATIYSSLEPCSSRSSRSMSCTQLILDRGIGRIVFAWREPAVFVDCEGAELLEAAGREVVEVPDLAHLVRETNAHLPGIEE